MLISLRGTNGSGKSTVIRAFFAEHKHRPIYGALGARLAEAYQVTVAKCKKPVFVLGPYQVVTGGCDRIIPFDLIPELINKYAERGHVIFEGVIVASIYGQIGALMEKHKKEAVMLFLDTPLSVCIERVQSRRDERSDGRTFDPSNLEQKYKATQRVKDRATKDGIMQVITARSEFAHTVMAKLLRGAK